MFYVNLQIVRHLSFYLEPQMLLNVCVTPKIFHFGFIKCNIKKHGFFITIIMQMILLSEHLERDNFHTAPLQWCMSIFK